jgi:hypothetical protein
MVNLMDSNDETKPERQEHGFSRTRCGCELCRVPCRHVPGGLDPADLLRLCPEGKDVFAWAEEHLEALTNRPFPTLVPARRADGACHWLFDGQCAVHEVSPYGCAFFDAHMTPEEAGRRREATVARRQEEERTNGLYYRVWLHLCKKGKIGVPGDRAGMREEGQKVLRTMQRRREQLNS